MKKLLSLSLAATFLAVLAVSTTAAFAAPRNSSQGGGGSTSAPLGIDISWPNCGKRLPADPAFVVVGVNGGLATTTNPCLTDQLKYAKSKATGAIASQDKIQLYVNTANPGGLGTTSWPTVSTAENPYTSTPCDGSDNLACAWQYGWNRAQEDHVIRFQPSAISAGVDSDPGKYLWWLDVETENTWKSGGTSFDYQSNVAVLEGMTAYFNKVNARVGIYSTAVQWSQIVGSAVSPTSNLNGLKNWRPGGASLSTAKSACSAAPLTAGGQVVLTQFISKGIDYNYSC
jgi:hypothetical protein